MPVQQFKRKVTSGGKLRSDVLRANVPHCGLRRVRATFTEGQPSGVTG